jgi:hypothetical protein
MTTFFRPTYSESTGPQQIAHTETAWHRPELTIYITDSCALSCTGCITYNNYALGGHLSVSKEVVERMESWARLITVDQITVLGGEPLSHPDLASWMELVERLWPQAQWSMVTNGRALASRTQEVLSWIERGWDFEVSSHSREDFDAVQAWWQGVTTLMLAPVAARRLRDEMGITDYWEDSEGRPMMQIGLRDRFYVPVHEETVEGNIKWRELTSARATHSRCPARTCTHLVEGRMYRCPVQATVPRLAERFHIEGEAGKIAEQDLGYDPLAPRGSLSRWMALLDQPTEQCRLCTWPRPMQSLGDVTAKKVKLVKKINPDSPATALEHPASLDDVEPLPEPSSQA